MRNRHLTTCWNCDSSRPGREYVRMRCPVCGACNNPPWVILLLACVFLGAAAGWLGGAAYGLVGLLAGWQVGVSDAASGGALLGALVFGVMGIVLAILVVLEDAWAVRDPEVLHRGAEVRRLRSKGASAAKEGSKRSS